MTYEGQKKFLVPVTWTTTVMVEVEGYDADDAKEEADIMMDLSTGIDLDRFENVDFVNGSFDIDFDMIKEK